MIIHELKCGYCIRFVPVSFRIFDSNLLMDKVYSHYIYLATYLKLINIHKTGWQNVRDNKICLISSKDQVYESISSWFLIHIHGFRFRLVVSYSEVEYETGKFKSDSLVFLKKLITLKVKISI